MKQTSLERYRNEPVAFVREVLGAEPWERQAQILAALSREPRVSVRSCNGAGKTLCAAWASLWFLLTRPGSIVITTAPTFAQVKGLLWRRLRTAYQGARVGLPGNLQTTMLECGTEWYAKGMATDQEVNFQGPHSPHGVLMVGDEASGLAEWLFAAMEGSMTEEGANMLLIGNPNHAAGTFYDTQREWAPAQRFHISAFDVPETIIRRGWIEEKREEWGEESPLYQVRVLGNFPPQGEDSLISLVWAEAAQERGLEPVGARVIGVDVARYGDDETCYYVRQGPVIVEQAAWRGQDTMLSAGRVAEAARRRNAERINVDEIGVGAGVVDRLREAGLPVSGINVGEKARDSERFFDRRSEIFFALSDRFKEGDIAIPKADGLLLDQLTQLRYFYTPRGQLKLESKDEMRKRRPAASRWHSPDRADALALTFCQGGNRWSAVSLAGLERPAF